MVDTEQSQLGPSLDGTVVLDIGGEVGALILLTGPELHLAEIEISRVDGAAPLAAGHEHDHDHGHSHPSSDEVSTALRTHVAVRERRGATGVRYAAIYPGLWSGEYQVWGVDGTACDLVIVVGGEVTQLDWR